MEDPPRIERVTHLVVSMCRGQRVKLLGLVDGPEMMSGTENPYHTFGVSLVLTQNQVRRKFGHSDKVSRRGRVREYPVATC